MSRPRNRFTFLRSSCSHSLDSGSADPRTLHAGADSLPPVVAASRDVVGLWLNFFVRERETTSLSLRALSLAASVTAVSPAGADSVVAGTRVPGDAQGACGHPRRPRERPARGTPA